IPVPRMLASLKFTLEDLEYSVPADFFDWVFSLRTTVRISPTLWAKRSSNKPLPREAPKIEPSATAGVTSAGAGTGAQNGSPGWGISRCTVAQACRPRAATSPLHFNSLFRFRLNIPITLALPFARLWATRSEERRVGKECRYRSSQQAEDRSVVEVSQGKEDRHVSDGALTQNTTVAG